MSEKKAIDDIELHAFVDGALDAVRLAEVSAAIEADQALAVRAAMFRADKATLKRVYASVRVEPVPEAWLSLIRNSKSRPRMSWRLVGSIAAALVLGITGTLVVQRLQPMRSGEIVEAALDARAAASHPRQAIAVGAASRAHQYDGVLRTAVALPVKVPDMTKLGYRLVGIRLYGRITGGGAAELLYRDGANQLFTLYVRRSDGKARFDQFERNGLRICIWQDEELSAVMAGNVSTAAMQRLAVLAYTGLTS